MGVLLQPGGGGNSFTSFVTTSPNSYSFTGMPTGSYSVITWYNTVGDGTALPIPHVGDYTFIYNIATCIFNNATPYTINTANTLNLTFTSTHQVNGIAGTVSYTGSLGSVNSCNSLHVILFQPGTFTAHSCTVNGTLWGDGYPIVGNGGRYDALPYLSPNDMCTSFAVDALAYYDSPTRTTSCSPANHSGPSVGDPYVILSSVSTSTAATHNITFGDTNIW